MKQAEHATTEEVLIHIQRQRSLGQKMIGQPRSTWAVDLIATALGLIGLAVYAYKCGMYPFN